MKLSSWPRLAAPLCAVVCLLSSADCSAQFTMVTAAYVGGASAPVSSRTIYWQPVTEARGGTAGGQAMTAPYKSALTASAFSGSVHDALAATPNTCYAASAIDDSGDVLLGVGQAAGGVHVNTAYGVYSCVQPAGRTWNFDGYIPGTFATVLPASLFAAPSATTGPPGSSAAAAVKMLSTGQYQMTFALPQGPTEVTSPIGPPGQAGPTGPQRPAGPMGPTAPNMTGCAGTGANLSCAAVSTGTTMSSSQPLLDIRHFAFADRAVCDGATDIAPVLQAAVNSLPSGGGEILIPGSPTTCYWANPTTFNWGSHGIITLFVQGTLRTGNTLYLPTDVNLIGKGGLSNQKTPSFQAPGETANLQMRPLTGVGNGTIGTAVTLTGMPTTFTPSSMSNIYRGTVINIAGHLTCSPSTTTRSHNSVTVTFASACHIPAGAAVTVASCADSTYNGTYAGSGYQFLATASDYVLNT